MNNFDNSYEVCNCEKVTIQDIIDSIKCNKIENLRDLQYYTKAGTHCRNCLLKEADMGVIRKKIYCKEILKNNI
ncbi:MAG: (2Fe-2S)-binding protein [Campylobacterota bacterium]